MTLFSIILLLMEFKTGVSGALWCTFPFPCMEMCPFWESEDIRPLVTRGELDCRLLLAPASGTSACVGLAVSGPPGLDPTEEPLELEIGLSGMDVRRLGGGSWEKPGRVAGQARFLAFGELVREDAALLDGTELTLPTEEDLANVAGGLL